jgi:hypothetical protein
VVQSRWALLAGRWARRVRWDVVGVLGWGCTCTGGMMNQQLFCIWVGGYGRAGKARTKSWQKVTAAVYERTIRR